MFFVLLNISFSDRLTHQLNQAQFGKLLLSGQGIDKMTEDRRNRTVDGNAFLDEPASKVDQSFFFDIERINGRAIDMTLFKKTADRGRKGRNEPPLRHPSSAMLDVL